MLDLLKPTEPNKVTIKDVKNCKLAPVFFDTFFNLEKWMEHEQKDPFVASRVSENIELFKVMFFYKQLFYMRLQFCKMFGITNCCYAGNWTSKKHFEFWTQSNPIILKANLNPDICQKISNLTL